jgi:hypothetical protein
LLHIGNSGLDLRRQREIGALFHCIVNVAVRVIPEQSLNGTFWRKGHGTALAGFVQ